jgi:transposase
LYPSKTLNHGSLQATTKRVDFAFVRFFKGLERKRQKTGLNRSILDTGWGLLRGLIEYKLAECDGVFVEVPTQKVKPSQTCPNCGHQEPKTLDQRTHECKQCGYTDDRDVAAAKVMLSWVLGTNVLNRGGESSTVSTARKSCGGFQQLSSAKRQKLIAQPSGGNQ